jgi:chromosome segregation ATPase
VLPHEMQPTETGRMYILELYQQAIDERDALEQDVADLTAALRDTQDRLETRDTELAAGTARAADLDARMEGLLAENQDLAARLATAQIRRLEAEQALLESKLHWLRQNAAVEAAAAANGTQGVVQ